MESKGKLVLFGAGKIGRSFIGQLFARSGYEVVFMDINQKVIDALNSQHSYNVHVLDDVEETLHVENVRGVMSSDIEKVKEEIATASILATSVGKNVLKFIIPSIAEGLKRREELCPGSRLDIIIAENMRAADEYIHSLLQSSLPADYPLEDRVGLVETSIGKMVPLINNPDPEDVLSVYAEAYNTLIVSADAFKNPIPEVTGMEAKKEINAWVDRKLFIHNFSHAAIAYAGYSKHPEMKYIYEVVEDEEIVDFAKKAVGQSAEALMREHPGVFTQMELEDHIADLLRRYHNKSLGDTIFRVGCDLKRKLSADDRIITPLLCASRAGLACDSILKVLEYALSFKATGEDGNMLPSDAVFHDELVRNGKHWVLSEICGLSDKEIADFERMNPSITD